MSYTFISGATGGIGKAFARACAVRGENLFITGRDAAKLSAEKDALISAGAGQTEFFACDLTDNDSRDKMLAYIDEKGIKFARIVNVAGVDTQKPFTEYTAEKILFQIRVNVESTVALTHALLKRREISAAEIITIGSMSGVSPMPYFALYSALTLYHLCDASTAFFCSIAVTASAMALAVRLDIQLAALIGGLGGYLAPVLFSTGSKNLAGLFGYLLLLGGGVFYTAWRRNWRLLNTLSFLLTIGLYGAALSAHYTPVTADFAIAIAALAAYFILFSLLPIVHNLRFRIPISLLEMLLLITGAAVLLVAGINLTNQFLSLRAAAVVPLGMALFYALMLQIGLSRRIEDRALLDTWLALGAAGLAVGEGERAAPGEGPRAGGHLRGDGGVRGAEGSSRLFLADQGGEGALQSRTQGVVPRDAEPLEGGDQREGLGAGEPEAPPAHPVGEQERHLLAVLDERKDAAIPGGGGEHEPDELIGTLSGNPEPLRDGVRRERVPRLGETREQRDELARLVEGAVPPGAAHPSAHPPAPPRERPSTQ